MHSGALACLLAASLTLLGETWLNGQPAKVTQTFSRGLTVFGVVYYGTLLVEASRVLTWMCLGCLALPLLCPRTFEMSLFGWLKTFLVGIVVALVELVQVSPSWGLWTWIFIFFGVNILEASAFNLLDRDRLVMMNGIAGLWLIGSVPYLTHTAESQGPWTFGLDLAGDTQWVGFVYGYTLWNLVFSITHLGTPYAFQVFVALALSLETGLEYWPYHRTYSLMTFLLLYRPLYRGSEASFPFDLRAWLKEGQPEILAGLIGLGMLGGIVGTFYALGDPQTL